MKPLAPLVLVSLAALSMAGVFAATPRMSVDELQPGMVGVGVTVFEGSEREEFDVEILGVLRNVMGPRRDVIVARLSGGPLAHTGVIQGMSGSPVYVDGRLIGAVSYALGSFPKEPIAGITPIDEMLIADGNRSQVARRHSPPLSFPVTAQSLTDLVRQSFHRTQPVAVHRTDLPGIPASRGDGGRVASLLQPITTPVVLNGFAPEVHDLWTSAFTTTGFATAIGGAQGATVPSGTALQAGDPVGAVLIRGDLTMAGTGTVTLVEDGRVYAFGHPFYNLGPVSFPMTRASVTTVLPSLAISSKIAAIGDVVGTLDQDRSTGIFGTLGAGPTMIPLKVHLSAPERDLAETFEFELIEDRLFSPLLTYTGVLSTFFSWTRELGVSTYTVTATTTVRDHAEISVQDVYSGQSAFVAAAGAIAGPLATLLNNEIAPVGVDGIEIHIASVEERRTAVIERAWIEAPRIRAGDIVPLHVLARSYRGTEILETVDLAIPRNARGPLQIEILDAAQVRLREVQTGATPTPDSVEQMITRFNRTPRNNRIYVKLTSNQPGAVVKGAAMPALPPSVLAVMESNRSGSGLRRLQQATLGEWQLHTDYAVSGSRTLSITVEGG